MPNTQHPGFFPMSYGTGGEIVYVRRRVLSNNSNPIGLQDLVVADTNGNILGIAAGAHATAVDTVAMGVSYQDTTGARIGSKNLPASTTYTGTGIMPEDGIYLLCVENAPLAKLRCSIDEAMVIADLRANCSIIGAAPVNGLSAQEVDASTKNSTATLPVRIVDFLDTPESDPTAADAHVTATINAGFTEPALTTTGLA